MAHKMCSRIFLLTASFIILIFFTSAHCVPLSGLARHGELCNSSIPCDSQAFLECLGSTCQCESPSNQRYVTELNICVSTVGGLCTLPILPAALTPSQLSGITTVKSTGRVRQCIPNAQCVPVPTGENAGTTDSNSIFAECRCMDGFIENASGSCVPGIGSPCNYGPDECNPLGMVMCKNGRCACFDRLQVYDPESKRCVSPAGTHCRHESFQLGCVKNALCYPFYYWIPPRCLCKPGYYQTPERTCARETDSHDREHAEDL